MDTAADPDAGVASHRGLKIALVGKGGVGKSTLSALVASSMSRQGFNVVAIDADEQRNLGATLGVDDDALSKTVALSEDADYVEEKTGARPGEGAGAMLRLNPDTSDVVERFSLTTPSGVRLLVMGGVRRAGGGCLCPETALTAAVIASMRLRHGDVVVMDTHAGVEHFGRSLARGFDRVLVVVEPTYNSVQVGLESARLAEQLGIATIDLVINRVRSAPDVARTHSYFERLGGFNFNSHHVLPEDELVPMNEPSVTSLPDDSLLVRAVTDLCRALVRDVVSDASIPVGGA